jgi:competence protein ComEC
VWLIAVAIGLRPTAARALVLVVLPTYAMLAGASPSAMRAAIMGMAYLGARLAGRAVLPLSAVLVAAIALVLHRPELVAAPGFQLTVGITAALVRWAPACIERLPGPRWVAAAVAVPVVAQIAAAPIVAWHFRTAIPGAVVANLAAPLLLAPLILLAVGAAASAGLWPALAGWQLDALGLVERALWLCGSAGRALVAIPPAMPVILAVALVLAGWLALACGRWGRHGAVAWLALIALGLVGWVLMPAPAVHQVSLLPVADGLAGTVSTGDGTLLVDGGRYRSEAAQLLADHGVRRLRAVLATHADEDHVGGLEQVLASSPAGELVMPAWMLADSRAVPLMRGARRCGAPVRPVVRGSVLSFGEARLEVLWPPLESDPGNDNERSLVARLRLSRGTVLITADIGHPTETELLGRSALACDVLVVPHHGSRSSSSGGFLDATRPQVALIPAGGRSAHHHPHRETLGRLRQRHIPFRIPAQSGWCGARPTSDGRWVPFP